MKLTKEQAELVLDAYRRLTVNRPVMLPSAHVLLRQQLEAYVRELEPDDADLAAAKEVG